MGQVARHHLVWVVALLLAPRTAGAEAGRLKISAGAGHLVLGEQQQATLMISGPTAISRIRVTTNVGRVERVEQAGPGRWRATYRCPEAFYPQAAIIAAVSDGRVGEPAAVGWVVLPLWGRGEAKVRTQREAEVTVKIGERTFGPVRADRRGVARVKVVVPPGVDHGIDGRGQRVDLELPPISRLHAVAWPTEVIGIKPSETRALVLSISADGTISDAARPPTLAAQELTASPPERLGAGLWLTRLTVPAGPPANLAARASIAGSAAAITVRRLPGPPAKVTVEPQAKVSNDDTAVAVAVRVVDALGTPVDTTRPLRAEAPVGRFGSVGRRGAGNYIVYWQPPRWSSRSQVTLRVIADRAAGQAELRLGYPKQAWRRRLKPRWLWTAVAVSAATLASGVITRGVALDKSSEYKDPGTTIPRRHELKDSGEPLTTYSSVALGLSAALAVGTAVIYYFTDFDHEQPDVPRLTLSGALKTAAGAGLTLHF